MKATKTILTVVLFTSSINLFSQTAEEWKKQGNMASDSNDYDKAIECYNNAIAVDSNYFDAYYNLGRAYAIKQDFDKSIEYFDKALTINDKDAYAYFNLGWAYVNKQDYDKAIELVKRGLQLDPNSLVGYSNLSFIYQGKGNYIYSTLYFKKAAQLGDTSAQNYFTENGMSWEFDFVKPNYEQIERNIEDKQSNFYYAKLWDRFQQGDSTMTLEEKRHLYYGYVFNDNYSPYSSKFDADKIYAILNKENPTKSEWEKLISLLDDALKEQPFNCKGMYYQVIAYKALDKPSEIQKNYNKINSILDALSSTGDALLEETAIHVIAIYSEYDYLYLNDLSNNSQALVNGGFDVLYLTPNENELEELWFDINKPFSSLAKEFNKGGKSGKKSKK